jgi:hypothetical protein
MNEVPFVVENKRESGGTIRERQLISKEVIEEDFEI